MLGYEGSLGSVHIEVKATAQARETPHSYPKPQGNEFMGPLTYKVFNLYFSIRYVTYNSHLHTTPPLKCESIYSSWTPFKRKLLPGLYRRCWFLRNRPTLYRGCCFLRKQTGCLGRTLHRTGLGYHYWVTRGARGDRPHRG